MPPSPRKLGVLARYAETAPRRQAEADRKASVMGKPSEPMWQPDYERVGGHALEAPMFSPDDLIGTGIPTKLAMMLKGAAPLIGGLGIIKNKGGNWLNGSVEGALKGLKRNTDIGTGRYILPENHAARMLSIENDLAAWKGGGIDPSTGVDLGVASSHLQRELDRLRPNAALNSFIDKQLTRYVKNDMATPEDPVRALAERGVLHYEPQWGLTDRVVKAREVAGLPAEGVGKSDLANNWETMSDRNLLAEPASTYQTFGSSNLGEDWINKLDPNTPFHRMKDSSGVGDLGFDHLTDELANALNPDSGLPRHLLLDPKSMDRVSVPQAVERVSQINAWRAAQKAEADAAKANNAATHLHKEYPDKGFKWVELTSNKDVPAEGYNITPIDAKNGRYWKVEGPGFKYPSSANTEAEAIAMTHKPALADALKYEGDTMGHCVGGYCDDVASGRSRIYSLRDTKGQPHVTIEVAPPQGFAGKKSREEYEAFLRGHETPHSEEEIAQALQDLDKGGAWSPRIQQIKGKQNKAPNEEYLPFVQDFVKSGKWSDVGDLRNSGLTAVPKESPLAQRLSKEGREVPSYMTDAEYEALTTEFGLPKYAHGGTVDKIQTPEQFQAIINAIMEQGAPCGC